MKLKKGFIIHNTGEEAILVATGKASESFNGIVRNNSTASFILSLLQNEITEKEIVDKVLEVYDIDRATAIHDVKELIRQFQQEGFLE